MSVPEDGAAARLVQIQVALFGVLTGLGVLFAVASMVSAWLPWGPHAGEIRRALGPVGSLLAPAASPSEQLGTVIGTIGPGAGGLVTAVWAPVNLAGLRRRRAWARTSSIAYHVVSLATCCCIPVGAYGLWSLLRADVRALFS